MDYVVRKKATLMVSIIILMTTMLCSCRIIDSITDGVNQKQEIETMSRKVMQCIVDENKEELLTFFSTDALNNHAEEVYPKIDSAFDFINGNIVSYDYAGQGGGSEKVHYGKVKYLHCYPEFRHVITDTGFEYIIEISYFHTWEEKPEREGVAKIEITDAENSKNRIKIGFFYDDL